MRHFPAYRPSLRILLAIGLLGATGCGASVGSVTGLVTYNGGPLKGGSVTLIPMDGSGESFSGQIQEDGKYTIERIKSGKYKVCVETSSLKPAAQGMGSYGGAKGPGVPAAKMKNEPPPGAEVPAGYKMSSSSPAARAENARRYVPIPDKYADPTATPLSVEVKGETHYDIPLG